jgi:hypothetical protein
MVCLSYTRVNSFILFLAEIPQPFSHSTVITFILYKGESVENPEGNYCNSLRCLSHKSSMHFVVHMLFPHKKFFQAPCLYYL